MDKTKKLLDDYLKNLNISDAISRGDNNLFENQKKQKLSLPLRSEWRTCPDENYNNLLCYYAIMRMQTQI